jgi:hypothetical protein
MSRSLRGRDKADYKKRERPTERWERDARIIWKNEK